MKEDEADLIAREVFRTLMTWIKKYSPETYEAVAQELDVSDEYLVEAFKALFPSEVG